MPDPILEQEKSNDPHDPQSVAKPMNGSALAHSKHDSSADPKSIAERADKVTEPASTIPTTDTANHSESPSSPASEASKSATVAPLNGASVRPNQTPLTEGQPSSGPEPEKSDTTPSATAPTTDDAATSSAAADARRKANVSGSTTTGAMASSTTTAKDTTHSTSKASPKPSLVSRFFRKLVPCIGPSPAHPTELGDEVSKSSAAKAPSNPASGTAATAAKSKPEQDKEKEKPSIASSQAEASTKVPSTTDAASSPSEQKNNDTGATSATIPLPIAVVNIPVSSAAASASSSGSESIAEVIVPPSPNSKLLPHSETEGVTSGAVQPPGSAVSGSSVHRSRRHSRDSTALDGADTDGSDFTEDDDEHGDEHPLDEDDEEELLIMNGGNGITIGPDGVPRPLLPPIAPHHAGRKCLVLDLDETLVHSSFKSISQADYVVPVEIEFHWHNVYVIKRPGVDNFLKKMGEIYEVVIFTASLSKYADPVLDKLDIHQVVSHRLFRESCYNHKGNYVKDLSQLGRPIQDTIILDNSPASYIFHPNNAVPVSSWFNDPHDTELTDLVPFLTDLAQVDDVCAVLDGAR